MNHLTLTTDQAALVGSSGSAVLVCDPAGQPLGILALSNYQGDVLKDAFSDKEIASAVSEAHATTDRRTTAQVLQRLDTLAERDRT